MDRKMKNMEDFFRYKRPELLIEIFQNSTGKNGIHKKEEKGNMKKIAAETNENA